jgi:hypothetical protein
MGHVKPGDRQRRQVPQGIEARQTGRRVRHLHDHKLSLWNNTFMSRKGCSIAWNDTSAQARADQRLQREPPLPLEPGRGSANG